MVAPQILNLLVKVRVLMRQPFRKTCGLSMLDASTESARCFTSSSNCHTSRSVLSSSLLSPAKNFFSDSTLAREAERQWKHTV